MTDYAYALEGSISLASWAIALIVFAAILFILGIVYCLLFFVLNKFIIVDSRVIRVFRVGTEEGQIHLLTSKCKMEYRIPEEVYETKQKAEEANKKI